MPKPVKIIITVISAVTVGFFSIIGFLILAFVGTVTVSSLIEGEPDTVQSHPRCSELVDIIRIGNDEHE